MRFVLFHTILTYRQSLQLAFLSILLIVTAFSSRTLHAASAGALDPTFDVGSSDYGVQTVAIQPDGRIVIAGTFSVYKSVLRSGIARINSDASLDLSFDAGSVFGTGNGVKTVYLYPDGKVLVAGAFFGAGRDRIARLNADGTLDPSFNAGSGSNGEIDCLAVQTDGKIIIGGNFSLFGGQSRLRLCRLDSSGNVDTNFIGSADNDVHSLTIQPDGKIIVGGWFSHLNGVSPAYLARLNSNGTVDSSFITAVNVPVERTVQQPDGKILVGGSFNFSIGTPLGRVTTNGSWDVSFSTALGAPGPWVDTICLQSDGRILIGGLFSSVNGFSRTNIARLYSDGSTDPSFIAAPDNIVDLVTMQADGRFIIAGGFGSVEGIQEQGMARLFGDAATAASVQINGSSFKAYQSDTNIDIPIFRSGDTHSAVSVQYATSDLEAQGGSDYIPVSGTLDFAPDEITKIVSVPLLNDGDGHNFERFLISITNAAGGTLGPITNATITVLGVNSVAQIITPDIVTNELAGKLLVTITRGLTNTSASVICRTTNGTAVSGINFSNLAQTVTFAPGQATNTVVVSLIDDDQPGPDKSFAIQLVNPVNIGIGTRSNMSVTILENDAPGHPAPGVNGVVLAVALDPDAKILLGGSFVSVNGKARNRIARALADRSLDQSFDSSLGANNTVYAVMEQLDGKIVCGGNFTLYNGTSRSRLMRLSPQGSLDASFDPGAGANDVIFTVIPAEDGGYFAGGLFTNYRGTARRGVAKISPDGTVNTNFVPQITANPFRVFCLATQADGKLLVGSDDSFGSNTNICLRLNSDGSRDLTYTNRISASPFGFAEINSVVPQPDGKILLGGSFSNTGIARVNTNGAPDSTFVPSGGVSFGTINKLLLLANGQIVAAGSFDTYGSVIRRNIVRINSNGSVDPAFDPGIGPDSTIFDVALLPGDRLAVGGSFRRFGGYPRYAFAILNSSGKVVTQLGFESFSSTDSLRFGLTVEPDRPFKLLKSSDLQTWRVLYTNTVHQTFTNLSLPGIGEDKGFFRIQQ